MFTIDEQSYHVLEATDEEVVGSCTVIPYNYLVFGTMMKTGLAVDVLSGKNTEMIRLSSIKCTKR